MFLFPAEIQGQEYPGFTGDGHEAYDGLWLGLRVGESCSGGRGSSEWDGAQVEQAGSLTIPVITWRLLTSPFCLKAVLGTHRQEHPGEEELLGRQEKVSGRGSRGDHGENE